MLPAERQARRQRAAIHGKARRSPHAQRRIERAHAVQIDAQRRRGPPALQQAAARHIHISEPRERLEREAAQRHVIAHLAEHLRRAGRVAAFARRREAGKR